MPRNGAGVYALPESPFSFDTVIDETKENANNSDIATELTNSVAKDGQSTMTGALKMGAQKVTGLAVGSAEDDGLTLRQAQAGTFTWCGTAGGTADAITLTPAPAIAAYADGQRFMWIAGASPNTGAMTIAVSALAAVAAQNDGAALIAGDHAAGKLYGGVYVGAQFQIFRMRTGQGSDAGLTDIAALAVTNGNFIVGDGVNWVAESGAVARASLGAAIGIDVQADLDVPSQAEAEAGTATTERVFTAERVGQAVAALSGLPRSYLAGLGLTNGTDAVNDIDIAVGECRDSTDVADLVLASVLVKRIDATWAVGTNLGGLDTGTVAANETYHKHLIRRSDTGVVDALFSLSPTAPTMPTNYDQRRRLGSITTNGVPGIIALQQHGDEFLLDVPVSDYNVTNPGTTATLRALSVPTDIQVEAIHAIYLEGASASIERLLVTSPDQADTAPSSTVFTVGTHAANINKENGAYGRWRTDTSGRIRTRLEATQAQTVLRGTTHGWIDTRGRDV